MFILFTFFHYTENFSNLVRHAKSTLMERRWRKYSKASRHRHGLHLMLLQSMFTRFCSRKIATHVSFAPSTTKVFWQMPSSRPKRRDSSASVDQPERSLPRPSHQILLFYRRYENINHGKKCYEPFFNWKNINSWGKFLSLFSDEKSI